jgi:hypothetical protein
MARPSRRRLQVRRTLKASQMKKILSAVLLGSSLVVASAALAHSGQQPKHGGIVRDASELSFELVPQAEGALLYVEDHGKPLATQGMSGKLTVLNGSQKSEAELKPAGDNKLEAKGVKLEKGAKAVASLSTAAKKTVTVRFTVK